MDTQTLRRICIFCGSKYGERPSYRSQAEAFGRLLAHEGIALVYGGSSIGLMGALADAVLRAGGNVIGVIPDALKAAEIAHRGLTELRVVPTMHARKQLMADLADAFVSLPGGLGTFDELFEIISWRQLGIHAKPIGLLNVESYYDALLQLIHHAATEGFVSSGYAELLSVDDDPESLLTTLRNRVTTATGTKRLDLPQA